MRNLQCEGLDWNYYLGAHQASDCVSDHTVINTDTLVYIWHFCEKNWLYWTTKSFQKSSKIWTFCDWVSIYRVHLYYSSPSTDFTNPCILTLLCLLPCFHSLNAHRPLLHRGFSTCDSVNMSLLILNHFWENNIHLFSSFDDVYSLSVPKYIWFLQNDLTHCCG